MNALDTINTRRLVHQIQQSIESHLLSYAGDEITTSVKVFSVDAISSYLKTMEDRGAITGSSVVATQCTGWHIESKCGTCKTVFDLENGATYHRTKRYSGRRRARVYGKRNWKTVMIVVMDVQPLTTGYISLTAVVERTNDYRLR
jgi:hypothetical protein